jgi:hypothetical protein
MELARSARVPAPVPDDEERRLGIAAVSSALAVEIY